MPSLPNADIQPVSLAVIQSLRHADIQPVSGQSLNQTVIQPVSLAVMPSLPNADIQPVSLEVIQSRTHSVCYYLVEQTIKW